MPIRFACPHCRQKLTVSSKKAGTTADCPRCKHALSIPNPPPGALVEVGSATADSAGEGSAEAKRGVTDATEVERHVMPQPAKSAAEHAPATSEPSPANTLPAFELPEELAEEGFGSFELVYDHDDEVLEVPQRQAADLVAVPRYVIYLQGGLIAVVALVAFILGLAAGGTLLTGPTAPDAPQACVIAGSVTYSAGARQLPDDGAVVAVIPQSAERPDEKATVVGLRPSDPMPGDAHRGVAMLRELGGGYTRADAAGRFTLQVPDRGQYLVLVISHERQLRSAVEIRTADLLKLGPYFENAADLLDKHEYQLTVEAVRGDRELSVAFD
jgi:transcription elongation factor Elf1